MIRRKDVRASLNAIMRSKQSSKTKLDVEFVRAYLALPSPTLEENDQVHEFVRRFDRILRSGQMRERVEPDLG